MPVPTGQTLAPPTSIRADCSVDVTNEMQTWLSSVGAGRTVVFPPGSCYRVDEGIELDDPQGLTLYGGTFRDESQTPATASSPKGTPVLTVVGGSGLTLEAMHMSGANSGGYHARLAFAGGIELEGTSNATIRSVTIADTFGDGITLAPLRGGARHDSGRIVAPVSAVTIRDATIDGVGRQGVTFASVEGAQLTDLVIRDPGLDTFDVEADQGNEGSADVTINGCSATGGALFFANGGAGNGRATKDFTIEHCTMTKPEGGSAVLVSRPGSGQTLRGPFNFVSDTLWCGTSAYVACVQLSGASVSLSAVTLRFPPGTTHEPVYHLTGGSQATFTDDVVTGYGRDGSVEQGSAVHVSSGSWSAY